MRFRPTIILSVLFLVLLTPQVVWGQASCLTAIPTTPVPMVPGQSLAVWTQVDHNTIEPDGLATISAYRGEVTLSSDAGFAMPITNWSIPKTAVTPVSGGGAGCVSTVVPAMAGLLPANVYIARMVALGKTATTPPGVSTTSNPFFLAGAPRGGTNTRVFTP